MAHVKRFLTTNVSIGDRLRAERDRLGIRQADFGAAVGVTRTSQFNYESGERSPDAGYLAAALNLGVDVLYVLTGSRSFVPPDPLTPREAVLLDNYRRAGEAGQRAIESTAAALAAGTSAPKATTLSHSGEPAPNAQTFAPLPTTTKTVQKVRGSVGSMSGNTTHYHGPIDAVAGRDVRYITKGMKPKTPPKGGT